MKNLDYITDAEKLTTFFGYWPSFHDAEVLWLKLDREPRGGLCGPTLEALVHAFEMMSEVNPEGYFVLRNHILVHFRFQDLDGLEMENFNHQNALMGLSIEEIEDQQIQVQFDAAFGVDAFFLCRAVQVLSVLPCTENGEPLP